MRSQNRAPAIPAVRGDCSLAGPDVDVPFWVWFPQPGFGSAGLGPATDDRSLHQGQTWYISFGNKCCKTKEFNPVLIESPILQKIFSLDELVPNPVILSCWHVCVAVKRKLVDCRSSQRKRTQMVKLKDKMFTLALNPPISYLYSCEWCFRTHPQTLRSKSRRSVLRFTHFRKPVLESHVAPIAQNMSIKGSEGAIWKRTATHPRCGLLPIA